ncbi:ATP-binding cassette domain-containing protein [Clostridium estertheticum]|uniref:ABC transporter ATP-binding protein n=1 Tax=Clostridium estertheticum TaxID=238834 RepID=UPI001CF5840F|nr:ABC transporter ATP-binding protein [Clostridium estertheticum]MCB2354191.1 ABC transporter ATP-binding protein [Clostridium estertheticum]WAG43320.1 ABC transporter ATP-binding protein [Clostridium estertheticum]
MPAIVIDKLVKEYKNGFKALDGLSLKVTSGEIFSLLGPNGAGKSSLINILTTLYKPTSGNVTMLGKDLCKNAAWVRTQIACVAQNVSIDEHLSLMENMIFQSRLYKVDSYTAKKRINTLIESFGLLQYLKYPVASYSGGVKRRLDIAMNMVSMPKILFLDEPTVGMDITSRKAMWEIMKKIRDNFKTTIFMTTHYLEEADELSDSICIMKEGLELAQGTPANLKQYTKQNILRIGFSDIKKAKSCAEKLAETQILLSMNLRENSIFADANHNEKTFQLVNKWLLEKDISFKSIEIVQPSLEDVFLKLTGTERR